jgi:NADPH:quinone reductase-like Zn-dependent oxidoreductase
VVRRAELTEELKRLGGDVVIVDGENLARDVARESKESRIGLALDGVGGQATGRLAAALSPRGVLAVYASMSEQPMVINPFDAIFRPLTIRGFWMGHPEFAAKIPPAMQEAARMVASGEVSIQVAGVYPIREVKRAAAHAAKGAKVLLEMTPSN